MVAAPVPADPSFPQSRPPVSAGASRPDPELQQRPSRRRFTVAYKLRIVEEAAVCSESRQVGALLRREGLYYSHLAKWRQQHLAGGRAALAQPRGRKAADPQASELVRVQQENARLSRRLAIAEEIIAVQKKVAGLLGLTVAEQPSP